MSQIRKEFYDAINKANNQKPKKTIKKFSVNESISLEQQIQNILNESDSAVLKDEVVVNNMPLVEWMYEITKKDENTLELEKRINQELEILNKLRDEARKKYNQFNRVNEFTSFSPSSAAASSSAGAGAGGGRLKVSVTSNSYVVDDYVDDYFI